MQGHDGTGQTGRDRRGQGTPARVWERARERPPTHTHIHTHIHTHTTHFHFRPPEHTAHTAHTAHLERAVRAEDLPEVHVVVAWRRRGELRKFGGTVLLLGAPVEVAAVGNHPADGGAMPAEPLSRRLDHHVGPELERPASVPAHPERVVNDQRELVLLADRRDSLEVGDEV